MGTWVGIDLDGRFGAGKDIRVMITRDPWFCTLIDVMRPAAQEFAGVISPHTGCTCTSRTNGGGRSRPSNSIYPCTSCTSLDRGWMAMLSRW